VVTISITAVAIADLEETLPDGREAALSHVAPWRDRPPKAIRPQRELQRRDPAIGERPLSLDEPQGREAGREIGRTSMLKDR
jgi:hypothetical protein